MDIATNVASVVGSWDDAGTADPPTTELTAPASGGTIVGTGALEGAGLVPVAAADVCALAGTRGKTDTTELSAATELTACTAADTAARSVALVPAISGAVEGLGTPENGGNEAPDGADAGAGEGELEPRGEGTAIRSAGSETPIASTDGTSGAVIDDPT